MKDPQDWDPSCHLHQRFLTSGQSTAVDGEWVTDEPGPWSPHRSGQLSRAWDACCSGVSCCKSSLACHPIHCINIIIFCMCHKETSLWHNHPNHWLLICYETSKKKKKLHLKFKILNIGDSEKALEFKELSLETAGLNLSSWCRDQILRSLEI